MSSVVAPSPFGRANFQMGEKPRDRGGFVINRLGAGNRDLI